MISDSNLAWSQLIHASAIGIAIGENILVDGLLREVPKYASNIPPKTVVASGALNLKDLSHSSTALYGLRQAYGVAISDVIICATVTICISILATSGMQRLNLAKISREREAAKETTGSCRVIAEIGNQENEMPLASLRGSACSVSQDMNTP